MIRKSVSFMCVSLFFLLHACGFIALEDHRAHTRPSGEEPSHHAACELRSLVRGIGASICCSVTAYGMSVSHDDSASAENGPRLHVGDTPPVGGPLSDENVYAFPNPFNPERGTVTFRFRLSQPGNVTVKVYDASGILVSTVVSNDPMDAETELQVFWSGRNEQGEIVVNGVYFYMIDSSAGERAVGKVAVLK